MFICTCNLAESSLATKNKYRTTQAALSFLLSLRSNEFVLSKGKWLSDPMREKIINTL